MRLIIFLLLLVFSPQIAPAHSLPQPILPQKIQALHKPILPKKIKKTTESPIILITFLVALTLFSALPIGLALALPWLAIVGASLVASLWLTLIILPFFLNFGGGLSALGSVFYIAALWIINLFGTGASLLAAGLIASIPALWIVSASLITISLIMLILITTQI